MINLRELPHRNTNRNNNDNTDLDRNHTNNTQQDPLSWSQPGNKAARLPPKIHNFSGALESTSVENWLDRFDMVEWDNYERLKYMADNLVDDALDK